MAAIDDSRWGSRSKSLARSCSLLFYSNLRGKRNENSNWVNLDVRESFRIAFETRWEGSDDSLVEGIRSKTFHRFSNQRWGTRRSSTNHAENRLQACDKPSTRISLSLSLTKRSRYRVKLVSFSFSDFAQIKFQLSG